MSNEPIAYINVEERKLEWAAPVVWNTPTVAQMDKVPLYTRPARELTDEEIDSLIMDVAEKPTDDDLYDFAKAILFKAQEK